MTIYTLEVDDPLHLGSFKALKLLLVPDRLCFQNKAERDTAVCRAGCVNALIVPSIGVNLLYLVTNLLGFFTLSQPTQ